MQDTPKNDGPENVNVTILGNNFTLRVEKPEKARLLEAVKNLQERTSAMLRANPNLTPQQAAILTALNTEVKMLDFLSSTNPFQDRAVSLIRKIEKELLRTQDHA